MNKLLSLLVLTISLSSSVLSQDGDDFANIGMYTKYLQEVMEKVDRIKKNTAFIENAKEVRDAIKMFESLVCTFEDLEFYTKKAKDLGYSNCFIDFDLEVHTLKLQSSGKLLASILLEYDTESASNKTSKLVQAIETYQEAHADIYQIKEDLKEIVRSINENNRTIDQEVEWILGIYELKTR